MDYYLSTQRHYYKRNRMNTLDWLKKLISFDTTSRYSNLSLIEYLANSLNDHQINPILIHDSKEPKANLLATIPGHNGRVDGENLKTNFILASSNINSNIMNTKECTLWLT